jgi:hypothetical protein
MTTRRRGLEVSAPRAHVPGNASPAAAAGLTCAASAPRTRPRAGEVATVGRPWRARGTCLPTGALWLLRPCAPSWPASRSRCAPTTSFVPRLPSSSPLPLHEDTKAALMILLEARGEPGGAAANAVRAFARSVGETTTKKLDRLRAALRSDLEVTEREGPVEDWRDDVRRDAPWLLAASVLERWATTATPNGLAIDEGLVDRFLARVVLRIPTAPASVKALAHTILAKRPGAPSEAPAPAGQLLRERAPHRVEPSRPDEDDRDGGGRVGRRSRGRHQEKGPSRSRGLSGLRTIHAGAASVSGAREPGAVCDPGTGADGAREPVPALDRWMDALKRLLLGQGVPLASCQHEAGASVPAGDARYRVCRGVRRPPIILMTIGAPQSHPRARHRSALFFMVFSAERITPASGPLTSTKFPVILRVTVRRCRWAALPRDDAPAQELPRVGPRGCSPIGAWD